MALLTKRELSEAKLYFMRRLAADDLSELQCREIVGLLKLSRSGHWLSGFVAELLCEYAAGERSTPQQVMVKLAGCIDAIESASDAAMARKLTGKRPLAAVVGL
jgi:hypothetical protein